MVRNIVWSEDVVVNIGVVYRWGVVRVFRYVSVGYCGVESERYYLID